MAKWTKKHRENHRAAMAAMGKRLKAKAAKPTALVDLSQAVITQNDLLTIAPNQKVRKNIGKKSLKALNALTVHFKTAVVKPVAEGNLKCVQILTNATTSSLNDLTLTELKWLIKNDPDYATNLRELSEVAGEVASLIEKQT